MSVRSTSSKHENRNTIIIQPGHVYGPYDILSIRPSFSIPHLYGFIISTNRTNLRNAPSIADSSLAADRGTTQRHVMSTGARSCQLYLVHWPLTSFPGR